MKMISNTVVFQPTINSMCIQMHALMYIFSFEKDQKASRNVLRRPVNWVLMLKMGIFMKKCTYILMKKSKMLWPYSNHYHAANQEGAFACMATSDSYFLKGNLLH